MMKLNKYSDIFEDVDTLDQFRRQVEEDTQDRFDNYQMVYRFDNMRPLHDASDLEKKKRREMINFGASNREAQEFIAPLESLVSGSNEPIKIEFDTNDKFVDIELSAFGTDTYNDLIYKNDETMATLWRTIVGYGWQRGAIPIVNDYEDEGLFPRVADNMRYPVNTPLKIESGINYFEFYEASLYTLEQMLANADSNEYIKSKGINKLIDEIKEAYKSRGTGSSAGDDQIGETMSTSADDGVDVDRVTINIVRYVEIRTSNDGSRYSSVIEYVSGYDINDKNTSTTAVIFADREAFKHAKDSLINCVFDEEVGGSKTTDNTRGIGEAIFAGNVAKEKLKNKRLEGAIATSMPLILPNDNMDHDEALRFKMGHHSVAPDGFTADSFFFAPDNTRALDPIISELDGVTTGLSSGSKSNTRRGQESRNQTLDRLAVNRPIRGNRLSKATKLFVKINSMMLHRLLTLDPDTDSADYNIIKFFQYQMDQKIKDLFALTDDAEVKKIRESLGERKFGYNTKFKVCSRRVVGDDPDRDADATLLINQMLQQGVFDPQTANDVKRWLLLTVTNDDDLVRSVFRDPEPIRKDQMLLAAFEWEVIKRRVFTGEEIEPDTRDIHIDHVQSHLADLISDVNMHGQRPWDKANVTMFGAAVNHVSKHIRIVQGQPESRAIFQQVFPLFQEVVKQSGLIIDELSQQDAQQDELSPIDEATLLLKIEQARLARAKTEEIFARLGIAVNDQDRLNTQTNLRNFREGRKLELLERDKMLNEIKMNIELRKNDNNL